MRSMRAITGRQEGRETLTGILERDRLHYADYQKLSGMFITHWIWDALYRLPAGKKVRITLEVLDD